MLVTKEELEKYLSLRGEENAIFKDKLLPRIQEICKRLHKFEPRSAYVDQKGIYVDQGDESYTIKSELLFDADWEATVDGILEKERIYWEKRMRRLEEESKKDVERREIAELEKLVKKYPNVAMMHPQTDRELPHPQS